MPNPLTAEVREYSLRLESAMERGCERGLVALGPFHYGWLSRRFMRTV